MTQPSNSSLDWSRGKRRAEALRARYANLPELSHADLVALGQAEPSALDPPKPTPEELEAKLAKVRARNAARLAQVPGERVHQDHRPRPVSQQEG
jgi:hypothetical protein